MFSWKLGESMTPTASRVNHSYTSKPSTTLKITRLSQFGPKYMLLECLIFGSMPTPCLNHVWTMFCVALLPDFLELWNIQDSTPWIIFVNLKSVLSETSDFVTLLFGHLKKTRQPNMWVFFTCLVFIGCFLGFPSAKIPEI